LALEMAAAFVLWRRDIVRFFRQRSRVVGALVQPLIFWVVIGSGFSGTFRLPGAEQVGYMEYFYPGIILMVVLFTSIFTTMSVIEDRHAGVLQAVMVAPAARTALVLGKTLGGTSIALIQVALFLALAPLAGFSYGTIDWPMLLLLATLTSAGLTATGFAIAWWLDSIQGYHAIMSVLLLPLWILSGSMFPARESGWMGTLMRVNPMSYAAGGIRRALYGGTLPPGVAGSSAALEIAVIAALAVVALFTASWVCNREA
jgi:daunorubicin resistance ABC transporter membrane protein